MPVPIGSVVASPTTINHFYGGLDGLFAQMFSNYLTAYTRAWIRDLFRVVPMDAAYMVAQGWFSVPTPGPFLRGEGLVDDGFNEFTYTLFAFDYRTPRLKWHINDLDDSRAPVGIRERVEEAARELAKYQERVLPELLTASASTFLHPQTSFVTPLGSTGLYNTAHAYEGQVLNNVVDGSGPGLNGVIQDFWKVRRRFREMLGSNGLPYWAGDAEDNVKWDIIAPPEMEQVINALFRSEFVLQGGATASTTNFTRDAFGGLAQAHILETLSDEDDWYVFRKTENMNYKPFVEGNRKEIERKQWTRFDSDWSKQTHEEAVQWWMRKAFGVGSPFISVKVFNA